MTKWKNTDYIVIGQVWLSGCAGGIFRSVPVILLARILEKEAHQGFEHAHPRTRGSPVTSHQPCRPWRDGHRKVEGEKSTRMQMLHQRGYLNPG